MNPVEPKDLFWHRVKLLALIAIFLSPFIGGWLALYVFEIRPQSGNYGTLVQPVQKIDWPSLRSRDGEPVESGIGRRWTLLLFSGDACAEDCRSNLFYMRQIRTLLGRNTPRLQNVLIGARPLGDDAREFLRDFPDLVVIEDYRDQALYRQFQIPGLEPVGERPRLYLVDPDRNLMMHYPAEYDQHKLLDDLRKLMKLSQIG